MSEPVFSSQPSASQLHEAPKRTEPAHVIIVGNEKGGSGKTTTTMHLIVGLLRLGFSVGSMDIDARQRSLSRYVDNRRQTNGHTNANLPLPHHIVIQKSPFPVLQEAEADERERFLKGLARIYYSNDFVVIDTPGSDTYLARLAHSFADTIITPINDSFVDLDVLAQVDGQTMRVVKPSIYSEMIWEQKLARAKRDNGSIEWIVMRNRLSNIDARNKRHMTTALNELSRRIGFRVAPGFSERVIFREMFLQGLTVLDVENQSAGLSLSHVAARQEVRELLKTLHNPVVDARIAELRAAGHEKPSGESSDGKPEPEIREPEIREPESEDSGKSEIREPKTNAPEAVQPRASHISIESTPAAPVLPVTAVPSTSAAQALLSQALADRPLYSPLLTSRSPLLAVQEGVGDDQPKRMEAAS